MAKLLIVTQKVDIDDPFLSFFHDWIIKFSQKFEEVVVICLKKGNYNLPNNVRVLSLEKEKKISRIKYLLKFYKYIWREKDNYDSVFVHMNPIYVVLGGLLWRLWNKKIILWYTHLSSSLKLRIAVLLANVILSADQRSFPFETSKLTATGHGIDVDLFKKFLAIGKEPNSILFVGRISKVKNIDLLEDALKILDSEGINYKFNVIGGENKVPNSELPRIYNQNEILVNMTENGSFDKVILEAMACETLVLTPNPAFRDVLPKEFLLFSSDPSVMADHIKNIFAMTQESKENIGSNFRDFIVQNHNLENLISKIYKISSQ